jgi:thiosulfate/3-mercaptopyruvate sulfurtransferase
MTTHGFAHPEYLVDPAWVQSHWEDADVVVLDIDTEAGYSRGHIPGSVMLLDNYERNPETGLVHTFPPERFAATCQTLGIGDDTAAVVYDNNMSLSAARFWWVMNYNGHPNVKVLDGGWRRWACECWPVSFDRAVINQDVIFTPNIDKSLIVEMEEVLAGCSLPEVVNWDTRTSGEYDGTVNRRDQRKGHVAGAAHLEWSDLMNRDTHRFKSRQEMRFILDSHGITPDKAIFAY